MPVSDTIKKLRKLAKKEGMPDIVCIERRQLRRLKKLAIAYLEKVAEEAGNPPYDEGTTVVSMVRAEIKQIKRCV